MFISTHIPVRGAGRRPARSVLVLGTLAALGLAATATAFLYGPPRPEQSPTSSPFDELVEEHERYEHLEELEGRAPLRVLRRRDAIDAAFPHESYPPGTIARLLVTTKLPRMRLRVYRAGLERFPTRRNDVMNGVPVTASRSFEAGSARRSIKISVGDWPSGLYFVRLSAPRGRVGFAPFVVRPRRLGESTVAIVLPTFTWQAYNFRDDDGDGVSDTWYARWHDRSVRLGRAFLDRGVPPHYRRYDGRFLRWLAATGRRVDVLTDSDLDALPSGRTLADAYDLLVFPGHHEYVTTHEYDVVTEFRNRGGNLMFLSANNFFWRVVKRGNVITRTQQWRDLGRPESALIGVQYIGNDRGERRGPWLLRRTRATEWVFARMGLRAGDAFSTGGIEIDATTPASPRGIQVIAEIPQLFGPRFTAQMTYYETPTGAKVFAAGAFTLAGLIHEPDVQQVVANVWSRLSRP